MLILKNHGELSWEPPSCPDPGIISARGAAFVLHVGPTPADTLVGYAAQRHLWLTEMNTLGLHPAHLEKSRKENLP